MGTAVSGLYRRVVVSGAPDFEGDKEAATHYEQYERDEQAERNERLGAKVRAYCEQRVKELSRSASPNPPTTIIEYMQRWAEFHGSGLGDAIAEALEAEARA